MPGTDEGKAALFERCRDTVPTYATAPSTEPPAVTLGVLTRFRELARRIKAAFPQTSPNWVRPGNPARGFL